jgi:hypothetical protein
MVRNRLLAAMLAGTAMLGFGGTANAASLIINSITSVNGGAAPTADIKYTPSNYSVNNVRVSPFNVTGTLDGDAVSLFTYCIDIFQSIHSGTYGVYSLEDYLGNTTRANYIAALISNVGAHGSATHDAAVQLALWELRYENTGTAPSFSSNNFKAWDISSTTLNLAKTYAQNARTIWSPASNIEIQVAKSSKYQDQLFWTVTPPAVPEPATWAMMIIGFGAVGSAMRARRGKASVSFA